LEAMVQAYYHGRGWDEAGGVPDAVIDQLELRDLRG
jgi:Aldehyde ferredoxin oxidoreductase, domains 2 & 3